jgi:predicted Zn-dependent protease
MTLATRIALVLAAAVGMAGTLGPLRAARDEAAAARNPSVAEQRLRRAADRTPSTRPELKLAQHLLFAGREEEAAAVLRSIVAREPANAAAWRNLFQATGDPAAQARYRALNGAR